MKVVNSLQTLTSVQWIAPFCMFDPIPCFPLPRGSSIAMGTDAQRQVRVESRIQDPQNATPNPIAKIAVTGYCSVYLE